MLLRYDSMPGKAQGILEQDTDREGQPVEASQSLPFQLGEPVDDRLAAIEVQGTAGVEGIRDRAHEERTGNVGFERSLAWSKITPAGPALGPWRTP